MKFKLIEPSEYRAVALVYRLLLLVGDKEADPLLLLECLDLFLLTVCTCSRTRCWPDRYWLTDGRASDVSSTFMMEMADFSGSRVVIFFFFNLSGWPQQQCPDEAPNGEASELLLRCVGEVINVNLALPCPALPCAPRPRPHRHNTPAGLNSHLIYQVGSPQGFRRIGARKVGLWSMHHFYILQATTALN